MTRPFSRTLTPMVSFVHYPPLSLSYPVCFSLCADYCCRGDTQVCQLLDVPYHRLVNMIRYMLISPPAKDYSGDYLWSECDVAAARAVLAKRANPPTTTKVDV